MKRKKPDNKKLSDQMKSKSEKEPEEELFGGDYPGNDETMISTGSTLLDLAISGGRKRGGGIPGGIFVEVFGPSSAGKTVLLCEIAGGVQRQGGEVMFKDPEARLNKKFAEIFDLNVDEIDYDTPNTVPEVFEPIRSWKPKDGGKVNGVFADSLAALSTDMEMEDKDKYGMRRAKEFSEELRRTCRVLKDKNMLLVGSNQIRTNVNAGLFEQKHSAPGGHALEFYASLRLRFSSPAKLKKTKKVKGKEFRKVVGVKSRIEVFKSSVWQPYGNAEVTILFDYGIDDIRANLQFCKDYSKNTVYTLDGQDLHKSMDKSIREVEQMGIEGVRLLKNETIDLWEEIQGKFQVERTGKLRV
jgi:RecA/RadA recombinase